jgi:hypothetical protein
LVTVKNAKGDTIASGSLGGGVWIVGACAMPFTVAHLPSSDFYAVTVGTRGAQTYSDAALKAMKYHVSLTLASAG